MVDLVRTPESQCASAILSQGKDLFQDTQQGEVQLEGVANVLSEPEFGDPEPLKALLRFIESPPAIRKALGFLGEENQDGVGVWIGQENPLGELRQFSMLTGCFDLDGRQGMLAVLGPRRMWYQRAFFGIDAMQQVMNITR